MVRPLFTLSALVVAGSLFGMATGAPDTTTELAPNAPSDGPSPTKLPSASAGVEGTIHFVRDGSLYTKNVTLLGSDAVLTDEAVPVDVTWFSEWSEQPDIQPQSGTVLGVYASPADEALRSHLQIDGAFGLVTTYVQPDSAADRAGLQEFDVLMEIDGQRLVNPDQFRTLIRARAPGDTAHLRLYRRGTAMTVEAVLESGEIHAPGTPPLTKDEIDGLNPRTHFHDFRFRQCGICHDTSTMHDSPDHPDI